MPNMQVYNAVRNLGRFIGPAQLSTLGNACRGEEREWFKAKLIELAEIVTTMPKTYETNGQGDNAIVYLHYFNASGDWYIIERDMEIDQLQAYGLADLGCPETGYISIEELIDNGVELDLHFEPKPLKEVRA